MRLKQQKRMRTRYHFFDSAVGILLYLLIFLSDSPTKHLITLPVRLVNQELGAFGACNGQTELLLSSFEREGNVRGQDTCLE